MKEQYTTQTLDKGFLLIPVEILTSTKYNGVLFGFSEKALYSYLLHWSKSKDTIFPSMARICRDLGIGSRTSVTKYIAKLEKMRLLEVLKIKGKSSQYTVLPFGEVVCDKPKDSSLISGTNEERRNSPPVVVEKQPEKLVHTQKPTYVPTPIDSPHYDPDLCTECGDGKVDQGGWCDNDYCINSETLPF